MINRTPELLAPAGDWPSLKAAVDCGADSVYFGVKSINMRHLASNFDMLELGKVMDLLRQSGRKGYLTLNTILMEDDLAKAENILTEAKKVGVDAVILWDMAALKMAKEKGLDIHLSTQASVANFEALKFYQGLGVSRVVLARECTLDDISRMVQLKRRENIPCEIETFIHGAMCVSISGRCFLSQYAHGKSANQGQCIQPCRREYFIKDVNQQAEFVLGQDYVLSPKDLCTMDFIDEMIKAGIDSFKIEGRMRSPEYARVVVSAYRRAIDAFYEGNLDAPLKLELKEQLKTVYNRGLSTGFYFGQPQDENSRTFEHIYEKIYIGYVMKFFKQISVAQIRLQAGDLSKGDTLIIIGKSTAAEYVVADEIQKDNVYIDKAVRGTDIGVKLPFIANPQDKVYLWKKK
ncbi:MAG: U32 family peptidase [Candidatus Omnitrophica bacterium]|nr:U32 family peptidase [Candidatus Omnitrophota bacterium]